MNNIFFVENPDNILRVAYFDDIDNLEKANSFIQYHMKDICLTNAMEDAYEEQRIKTCKGNLVVFMRFLNI